MERIISQDGTAIAFERRGDGPPLVLVMGAFNDRSTGRGLAAFLAARFTVLTYDRRGRGDSGDAPAYAIEREIEDLDAIIRAAGGQASVFGFSSGAVLAALAAARGLAITKLALYEPPPPQAVSHAAELASLVAAGRRGDAVEHFQLRMVGIPEPVVAELRHAPFRPALEAMAHTLVYDAAITAEGRLTAGVAAQALQSTLVIAGGASPPSLREAAEAVARWLPNGRALTIPDATHDLDAPALGPALVEHFV